MNPTLGLWLMIGATVLFAAALYAYHAPPKKQQRSGQTGEAGLWHSMLTGWNKTTIGDSVEYMRALGFFTHRGNASNREIANDIRRKLDTEHGTRGPHGWRTLAARYSMSRASIFETDLLTIAGDVSRVWWRNLDQVRPDRTAYVTMLQRWAEISREAFNPTCIAESWGAPGEPIFVSFTVDGEEQLFVHLTSHDNYLDTVGVRALVNPLIAESGIQFEIVDFQHTPNIVLALTAAEREQLTRERGWMFTELPALVI